MTDIITIAGGSCTIGGASVDVNITHPYIGDLHIRLMDPSGTILVLKTDSDDMSDDIVGNYPMTLTPAEPLRWLGGASGIGDWTLLVADYWAVDEGTLNSWAINLNCLP